jgi:hypothetical protein
MMKPKKLALTKQTIRVLASTELNNVAGGWIRPPITVSCPQPSASGCCPASEK